MDRRPTTHGPCLIVVVVLTLLAACGGGSAATTDPSVPADGSQPAAQLFEAACASCHGPSGQGGLSGVPLNRITAPDRQSVIDTIRHGSGAMPAAMGDMSDEQISALADYVVGLR